MLSICRTFPCIWLLQNLLSGIQSMLLYGVWNKTCFVLVCFSNCLQCLTTVRESSYITALSLAILHGNCSLWPQLKFVSLSPKYISCPLAGNFDKFWIMLKHSEGQRESMKPSLYFPRELPLCDCPWAQMKLRWPVVNMWLQKQPQHFISKLQLTCLLYPVIRPAVWFVIASLSMWSVGLHSDTCQSVQSLSRARLSATPGTTARQASLAITNSRSLLKPMSIESVMPSSPHPLPCPSPPVPNPSQHQGLFQ